MCLYSCQKDDAASMDTQPQATNGYTVKTINLSQLERKHNLQEALGKISSSFDINKQKTEGLQKIDAADGSFTLLTDEIIEVATDSTVTYSFLLEVPTDPLSAFENFVLEVKHDTIFGYHHLKYRFVQESTEEFPYAISFGTLPPDLVSLEDITSQMNKMVQIGNVCIEMACVTSPRDWECSWVILEVYTCGGGGSSGSPGGPGSGDGGYTGPGSGDGGGGSNPSNPSDPGNGQGNGGPTPVIGVNDPKDVNFCNFFKDLTENETVNGIIELYKESTSVDTEVGILLSEQADGSYNAIVGTVPDEEYAVQFDVPNGYTPLHFMIHTHNTGGLSIFSPQDFEQIYQLMVNQEVSINNPFVSILVTESDVYAMSFTNPQTFVNFGNLWFNDPIKFEVFKDRFFRNNGLRKYKTYGINGDNDNAANEQHFMEMLQHQNMGFMVHRANEDLSQWERLKINPLNGNVQGIPCN